MISGEGAYKTSAYAGCRARDPPARSTQTNAWHGTKTSRWLERCEHERNGTKPPFTAFGFRGDNLLNTRNDNAGKFKKRYKTFKPDFEFELGNAFGMMSVDYELSSECRISDVIESINAGPSFDILCVGIGINDLMASSASGSGSQWSDPSTAVWGSDSNVVVPSYPDHLDRDLQLLAEAIKSKSKGSLVLVGGPSSLWNRPARWDGFMATAMMTLQEAGVQVVPRDARDKVLNKMKLSSDGIHFSHDDKYRWLFAQAWVLWLQAAAAEKAKPVLESQKAQLASAAEVSSEQPDTAQRSRSSRSRSRSPPVSLPAASAATPQILFPRSFFQAAAAESLAAVPPAWQPDVSTIITACRADAAPPVWQTSQTTLALNSAVAHQSPAPTQAATPPTASAAVPPLWMALNSSVTQPRPAPIHPLEDPNFKSLDELMKMGFG